jgi:hypothetical protein
MTKVNHHHGAAERYATERPTWRPRCPADSSVQASAAWFAVAEDFASSRPTSPPGPDHSTLRDSCRDFHPESGTAPASGPRLGTIPFLLVSDEVLEWLELEASTRGIAWFIDDMMTVEEVLALAQVPVDEGLRIFDDLASRQVVGFRPGRRHTGL